MVLEIIRDWRFERATGVFQPSDTLRLALWRLKLVAQSNNYGLSQTTANYLKPSLSLIAMPTWQTALRSTL